MFLKRLAFSFYIFYNLFMSTDKYIFRGRCFNEEEISLIKRIVEKYYKEGRKAIARIICEHLNWYQPNGRPKIVSCLEALRRMNEKGILNLPPSNPNGGYRPMRLLSQEDVGFSPPEKEITESSGEISFRLANSKKEEDLWRYLIQRYHYLGYRRVVGRYLKYFVYLGDELVALIGFADGLYHHNLRDRYLCWDRKDLEKKRHLVINNVRFLILPWVKVKNLGSRILSFAVKVVPLDWERIYGVKPIAFETFVDMERFKGTVYKAANWVFLGITEGKGRRGLKYFIHNRPKAYYLYLLERDYLKSHGM